jgi:hypothetical protein
MFAAGGRADADNSGLEVLVLPRASARSNMHMGWRTVISLKPYELREATFHHPPYSPKNLEHKFTQPSAEEITVAALK